MSGPDVWVRPWRWWVLYREEDLEEEGSDASCSGNLNSQASRDGVPVGGAGTPEREGMAPKQELLQRILMSRDSIEAEKGLLSESFPLIREGGA